MKLLLTLFILLCYSPSTKIDYVPFESQCYDSEKCESLNLMKYESKNQLMYPITDSKNYQRYKNNFDSVIWQTFFDHVPIGHISLTQKWHLSELDNYEYTQGMVRIDGGLLMNYTHKIKGDALAYIIINDVLEDFNQLVSDGTLTNSELFDQQAAIIREKRVNQYRTECLNGIIVYEEAGEVPDELIVMMAQKAFDQIQGYYSDIFDIALKGTLAAELKDAVRSVELVEEEGKIWLTLSEKAYEEDAPVLSLVNDESEGTNENDWIYVSLILTVLFALVVWFFGYSG